MAALRRLAARLVGAAAVQCPCCGGRFRRFDPFRGRPDAVCRDCGALERHRLLWLYVRERTDLLDGSYAVLHVAPEEVLERRLRALPGVRYTSVDLEPGRAMVAADLTALPFADEAFDVILCLHVLEHVPDDRAAMRELRRVLRPGGWAVIDSPVDVRRYETFEDPSITDPAERLRLFSQADHVRVYGRDFADRLRSAGFLVSVEQELERRTPAEVVRYGLPTRPAALGPGRLHVCRSG